MSNKLPVKIPQMNWNNLLKNKCPKCGKDFLKGLVEEKINPHHTLFTHLCGFNISEQRYKELTSKIVTERLNN